MDSMSIGPIQSFLTKVSQNWDLSFIFSKIWAVSFSPAGGNTNNNLGDSIVQALNNYTDINKFKTIVEHPANIYRNLLSTPSNISIDVSSAKHFILANKLTIPGDKLNVIVPSGYTGDLRQGGAMMGSVVNGMNNIERKMTIAFIDTNLELADAIFKPWIAALGWQGAIECSELPSLKTDITCCFFAKSSPQAKVEKKTERIYYNKPSYFTTRDNPDSNLYTWTLGHKDFEVSQLNENQPFLRKTITFKNAYPIDIPDKSYDFGSDGGNELTQITFNYDYYTEEINSLSKLQ